MIADVDESLRRLLASELGLVPGCAVHHSAQVAFDPPAVAEAIGDGAARVNLYLHDVRENVDLRDEGFRSVRSTSRPGGEVGRKRAPVHLDLQYLLTVYAGDDSRSEHRLLTQVLGVLLRCLAVPPRYLNGSLAGLSGNAVRLQTAQPDALSAADTASLWQAVGGRMRPALQLKVTAPFDPFETQWTRGVREALFGLAPAEASAGGASTSSTSSGPNPAATVPSKLSPSLGGIVLEGERETPLENVRVLYRPASTSPGASPSTSGASASTFEDWEEVQTDGRGIWALRVAPGEWSLKFEKAGFNTQEVQVLVPTGAGEKAEPVVVAMRGLEAAEKARRDAERMRQTWEGARGDRFLPPVAKEAEASNRNGHGANHSAHESTNGAHASTSPGALDGQASGKTPTSTPTNGRVKKAK
jgi:hypothetical protein